MKTEEVHARHGTPWPGLPVNLDAIHVGDDAHATRPTLLQTIQEPLPECALPPRVHDDAEGPTVWPQT